MESNRPERRRVPRARTLKGATMVFNNGNSVIDCVVRDLTHLGARLRVEGAMMLPDRFRLIIGQAEGHQEHEVSVIWRSASDLGVAFDR